MPSVLPLTELKPGQSGKVIAIYGGRGIRSRLSALGLRTGVIITRVSSALPRGPVAIDIGGCQLAIGYGQACRVYVETSETCRPSAGQQQQI